MDPFSLIGALAGAGGGIASALLGGDAADQAAAWNYAINERNLRAQKKQQQNAIDYADKIRGEQHLGATDALGNTTKFVPGKGWVSTLSPEQQKLYDYFFKQELPERRAQFQRGAEASRNNDDVARGLLAEFRRIQRETPMDAANQLYYSSTRGASDANREMMEAAMRQAARTGNSNVAGIMAQMGRQSMDQRAAARQNADIQAEDYVNDKYNSARSGLANLYQMFLAQAGKPLDPSFDPTGIPQNANSLMNVLSNQAQQGNSMGFNSRSVPAPQMANIEPNNAWANAAGAIGSSLSGLGTRLGGLNQQASNNALMQQFLTGGGQLDFGSGGIFGRSADRLRLGQGNF